MFTTEKRVVVSVINDLVTDSRVQRTCSVLKEAGYEVLLIGRQLPNSIPFQPAEYHSVRMKLMFTKGPFFYFFFNLRLFFKLLFTKADLLFANDLDTLWPNYVVSKIKGIPVVYDSHELFCEVPELQNEPMKKKIWEKLEKRILPKLKYCITVNDSIARIFQEKYNVPFIVIRNIPIKENIVLEGREKLGLPMDKKIILLQGAGINIDRGAEELLEAMKDINNATLLIIGGGDVWPKLEELCEKFRLNEKVKLIKKIPKKDLMQYTAIADLGISLDKSTNPNYYNSLPNKVFDYLQAGVPILASKLPEIEKVLAMYDSGWLIDTHNPKRIAEKINDILNSEELLKKRTNALKTASEVTWEKEKAKYLTFIKAIQP